MAFPGEVPADLMFTGTAGGAGEGSRVHPTICSPPLSELSSQTGTQGQGEGRGSSLSIHSLPSGPSSPFPTEEQPVASWALSFERLLHDPLGLAYFTVSPGVGWGGAGWGGRVPESAGVEGCPRGGIWLA